MNIKNLKGNKKNIKNNLNNKADELQNKSNEINDIIDNLKPAIMNKNNFAISNEDIDKIKKYIEQTDDTTFNLKKKIKTRDDRIEELEYDLNDGDIIEI